MFSEKKIILLYLQASCLNISNVGFGMVFTTEFKLQGFNSEIGSLKKKFKKILQTMKLKCTFLVL